MRRPLRLRRALPRSLVGLGAALVAASALLVMRGAPLWSLAAALVLGWTLLTIALVDLRRLVVPDRLSLPLIALGLAVTAAHEPTRLAAHAAAATLAWLAFTAIAALYRHLRGRDGLGGGDAKLLAAGGAWLGPAALPSVVALAAITALLVALVVGVRAGGLDRATKIPFAPALALAIWTVWLLGPLEATWL